MYIYPVYDNSAMNFFCFLLKWAILFLLTAYAVLYTTSREIIKLCWIRKNWIYKIMFNYKIDWNYKVMLN